jgi:hypothetical protein
VRKGLLLLWTPLVVGLTLLLPASVFASSVTYETIKNTCSNSGGSEGYGKSVMSVKQDEYGKSGVVQFGQHAIAQEKYGGRWHNVYSFAWKYSNGFTNTSANHSYTLTTTFDWGPNHVLDFGRIKWRGEWYDNYGNLLYFQNLTGRAC